MIEARKLEDSIIYLTLNETDYLEGDIPILNIYLKNNSSEPILVMNLDVDLSLDTMRYNQYLVNIDLQAAEYSYIVTDSTGIKNLEDGLCLITEIEINDDVTFSDRPLGDDIIFE